MRGVCVTLAKRGYAIAANYRAPRTNADETVRAVRAVSGRVEAFAADVSDPNKAASLVTSAQRGFGSVDVLVCGAGPMTVKEVDNTSLDDYRQMIDGNMSSVFY